MAGATWTGLYLWLCYNAQSYTRFMGAAKMNDKESPKESFEKFTGHMFLKQLRMASEDTCQEEGSPYWYEIRVL